ncbi:MAG: hypothetical protein LAP85_27775, partial [Acidobacteriia bacterium]|nr:hypothetical protein [Terriglobia bacterium]
KQRDFPTFPTGPTGLSFSDVKTKTPGSESTLRRSIFCLDNGVHLSSTYSASILTTIDLKLCGILGTGVNGA